MKNQRNEEIIARESQNDGSRIHLYYDSKTDAWIGYGPSAYALRLLVKRNNSDNLRSHSNELNLPCTMVGDNTMKRILESQSLSSKIQEEYIHIENCDSFDMDDYARWGDKLREERSHKKFTWVDTPVSKYVPRDKFIPDGMSAFSRNSKRLFDLFSSMIALIVFSPLFLICYILVRREDGGPAIFKQERIGRFGKPFYIYKFRSMRLDSEKFGPQLSHSGGDDDPRLTKIGLFIRRHHLDELPQLWNVFCGDMSFVGPRPERKYYIDQIVEYDKRYVYLYQIRPGVTSYATLYNGYTDTMEKMLTRLEMDLHYMEECSFWLDMKIITLTAVSILTGKKF